MYVVPVTTGKYPSKTQPALGNVKHLLCVSMLYLSLVNMCGQVTYHDLADKQALYTSYAHCPSS